MNSAVQPLVSICIVAYNHEKYISQCLESVLQQKADFDFEIIISDDASTDKTSEIISDIAKKNPKTIKYTQQRINIGPFKNYIITHSAAQGKYIAHLDGDDYWLPGKLKKQISFLEENYECSAVYSNALVFDQSNNFIGHFNKEIPGIFNRDFLLEKGNFLNASSLIYRSFFREKILPYDEEFIDYRIHLRCSGCGHLGYINQPLVSYRTHADGMAVKFKEKVRILYWNALIEVFSVDGASVAFQKSIVDFFGEIIFQALLQRNFIIIPQWKEKIHRETLISKKTIAAGGYFRAAKKIYDFSIRRIFNAKKNLNNR